MNEMLIQWWISKINIVYIYIIHFIKNYVHYLYLYIIILIPYYDGQNHFITSTKTFYVIIVTIKLTLKFKYECY